MAQLKLSIRRWLRPFAVIGLVALSLATSRATATTVTVPGTSDPWLAGMPDGATASAGDVAPDESPVQDLDASVTAGGTVTFAAIGSVNYVPGDSNDPPDGNAGYVISHGTGAENGISDITVPVNSLIGVFLGPNQPDAATAPAPLDFSTSDSRDYTTLAPLLQQVFFIGDGITSTGVVQQVTVPAGATRLFLGMMDGTGWYNNSGSFTVKTPNDGSVVIPAPPTITLINPGSAVVGTSVTLTGTVFTDATGVQFNGTAATTFSVVSDSQITATVPTGATTGLVTVTTPRGTATSASAFTVLQPPAITSFTPGSGLAGATVTLTGTSFTGATAVQFNGVNVTTFSVVSDTQITATVPTGATTGTITVTTPNGTATSATPFTVLQPPTISSLTPGRGLAGVTVTITGTGLSGATAVKFYTNSAPTYTAFAAFTVVSDTQINATVPADATSGTVRVITPGGVAFSATAFIVVQPPTITGFTSVYAFGSLTPGAKKPEITVIISGTNFTGATAVKFNGLDAPFKVASSLEIQAKVPAGATTGPLSVTTPNGTATSTTAFRIIPPPTITSFTPASGPVGTVVTLTGTALSGAHVYFGNRQATVDTLISSDTRLSFTVPAQAVSSAIFVITAYGQSRSVGNFTVTPGDGISGHVFELDGKTPQQGVRVCLVKNGDLAALLGGASPDIISVTTDASGAYHLPGQAAGTYLITPFERGVVYTSSHGVAPVTLAVSGNTTLDFTVSAFDQIEPLVTVTTPAATSHGPVTAVTGTITDKGSGPLAVVVALVSIVNGKSVGIYDWRAQTFVAANSQDPGVLKTVPTSGPNWTLALPTLAPGTYRVSVLGLNHAFRPGTSGTHSGVGQPNGVPISRDFTLDGGGTETDTTAPTVSITRVNGSTLPSVLPGTSALSVLSLLQVEGTATDNKGGSGVAKVNLYLFRNPKTVIPSVAYSAEFWNGTSWVSVTVSPLSQFSALPALSTTIGTTTGGVTSWNRSSGFPMGAGVYDLAAVAFDKAGNVSDYLSIFTGARMITVTGAKSVGMALSIATAQAAMSSITLRFLSALDADSASDASHYSVTVNGGSVAVESAGYNAATHTVTLALSEGVLHGGDMVMVQGSGLSVSLAAR